MEKIVRDAHRAVNNQNQLVLSAQNHLTRLEEVIQIPCVLQAVETDQPLKCTLPNGLLKEMRSYASIEGGSSVRAQLKLAKDVSEDLLLSPATSPLPSIDMLVGVEPPSSEVSSQVSSSCDTSEVGSVVDQKEHQSVRTKKKTLKPTSYKKSKMVNYIWFTNFILYTLISRVPTIREKPLKPGQL